MSRNVPAEMPVSFFHATASLRIVRTLGGLACGVLILLGLAFLRAPREPEPKAEIYTARLVTLPFDEPPPPPREQAKTEPGPIVGPMQLEIASEAASAVHIQVPDVPLVDTETQPPPARAVVAARFDIANSIAHPLRDSENRLAERIFSRDEVDQRPMVVFVVKPKVSDRTVKGMATPRTVLLLVVKTDGTVGDIRVMHGSGNDDFDQAIIGAISDWRFSPAILKGQKVRCWVEQAITVKLSDADPFEAH